jgi:Invasion associated locus B (IalB) protein
MRRPRLFGGLVARICSAMRAYHVLITLFVLASTVPVLAQHKPAARPAAAHPAVTTAPKAIGKFDDWTAATNIEAGQKTCYAFTRAESSSPSLSGRSDVVLTVTERPTGRDAVALSAGFEYAPNATVALQAEQAKFDFYTAKRSAFARDGHATVVAFRASRQLTARSPGPKGKEVTDTFSLKGFDRAYAAIVKECPAK